MLLKACGVRFYNQLKKYWKWPPLAVKQASQCLRTFPWWLKKTSFHPNVPWRKFFDLFLTIPHFNTRCFCREKFARRGKMKFMKCDFTSASPFYIMSAISAISAMSAMSAKKQVKWQSRQREDRADQIPIITIAFRPSISLNFAVDEHFLSSKIRGVTQDGI